MPPLLDRKLRFSDAAYAIGSTPKSLRLWLQRGLVQLHTPKPEGGAWTEYSFYDIAILALVRPLVTFGVDVQTASSFANTIMGDHFFPQLANVSDPGEVPVGVLATVWTNRRIFLFRKGDEWIVKLVALWESELPSRIVLAKALPDRAVDPDDARLDLGAPSGIAALRRELEPAPVYISIDVEAVLRAAFARAHESVNDGAVDDDELD